MTYALKNQMSLTLKQYYKTMLKNLLFLLALNLIPATSQSQCETTAKEVWDIIQKEEYQKFKNFLMPIDQQRKRLHMVQLPEVDEALKGLTDKLYIQLIASAKTLREDIITKGLNINTTKVKHCLFEDRNTIQITISDMKKDINFSITTAKTDRTYLTLPINAKPLILPKIEFTKEQLANSTMIIDGEEFKTIEPTAIQKQKGLHILNTYISNNNIKKDHLLLLYGMKDKHNVIFMTYMVYKDKDAHRYVVNLNDETCIEDKD
jgi:hypothetical protein